MADYKSIGKILGTVGLTGMAVADALVIGGVVANNVDIFSAGVYLAMISAVPANGFWLSDRPLQMNNYRGVYNG